MPRLTTTFSADANSNSSFGIITQDKGDSQEQNSAVLPASALETDEAYLSVAEKYRDGTATEAWAFLVLTSTEKLR